MSTEVFNYYSDSQLKWWVCEHRKSCVPLARLPAKMRTWGEPRAPVWSPVGDGFSHHCRVLHSSYLDCWHTGL